MRRMLGGATAAITLVAGSLLISTPAQAAPACTVEPLTTTCVFQYSGSAESWTVPSGVVEVAADLYGAQGGSVASFTIGGNGGRATSPLSTTPGAQLWLNVGGSGSSVPGRDGELTPASGGFNGGGNGGGGAFQCRGAGGGGATDIRTASGQIADRLLIAGGGGGSANGIDGNGPFFGGGGGGLVGQTGGSDTGGGSGGNQTGGGSGLLGEGSSGTPTGGFAGGAGGGGGGYYGGAGGKDLFGSGTTSYGGGGGSGFGPATTAYETGVRVGNGEARISYPTVTLSDFTAASVTHTSASLSITVNPNGRVSLPVQIRYGTDPASLTSVFDLAPLSGSAPTSQSIPLTGLAPETSYTFEAFVPGDSTTEPIRGEFTTSATPIPPDPEPEPEPEPEPQPESNPTPKPDPDIAPKPDPKPAPSATPVMASRNQPGSLAHTGAPNWALWTLVPFAAIAAGGVIMTRGRTRNEAR